MILWNHPCTGCIGGIQPTNCSSISLGSTLLYCSIAIQMSIVQIIFLRLSLLDFRLIRTCSLDTFLYCDVNPALVPCKGNKIVWCASVKQQNGNRLSLEDSWRSNSPNPPLIQRLTCSSMSWPTYSPKAFVLTWYLFVGRDTEEHFKR